MTLADMLVVMNAGRVEQIGPPLAVYERPATTFVASFIGAPPMNLLRLSAAEAPTLVNGAGISVPADGVVLGMRPEDLSLSSDGSKPAGGISLEMTVGAVERVGPETFVYGVLKRGDDVIVRLPGQSAPAPGERITAVGSGDKLHLFSVDGQKRLTS
jgi:sn-glycerol 3-phosphate transport system ATP-binding protein